VLLRSAVRQLRGNGAWAKTAREPIDDGPAGGPVESSTAVASGTREPVGRAA
jgi:hypothetical protein